LSGQRKMEEMKEEQQEAKKEKELKGVVAVNGEEEVGLEPHLFMRAGEEVKIEGVEVTVTKRGEEILTIEVILGEALGMKDILEVTLRAVAKKEMRDHPKMKEIIEQIIEVIEETGAFPEKGVHIEDIERHFVKFMCSSHYNWFPDYNIFENKSTYFLYTLMMIII